jgi:hypothetical protein
VPSALDTALRSYLPADRRAAADDQLAKARAEVHDLNLLWEGRDPKGDHEELRVLRERLQGAKGQVTQWTRYIKSGCPRSR